MVRCGIWRTNLISTGANWKPEADANNNVVIEPNKPSRQFSMQPT